MKNSIGNFEHSKLKKSLLNSTTSLLAVSVNVLLGLFIPRLILVNYGSETNGLVNSINQFVAYLNLFEAGIGIVGLQILYKPVAEADHDKVNSVLAAINLNYRKIGCYYFFSLLLLSVCYPLLVLHGSTHLNYFQVFMCVLFSGLGNVILFFVQGKYRILLNAEGKSYILNNLQTVISILISVTKVILLTVGLDIVSVIVATFALNLIQVAFILLLIRRQYGWINLKVPSEIVVLAQKSYAFIHQVAWMVFLNTDVLVLTIFCNLKVVSVYAMYKLVVSSLENLLNIPLDSVNFALGQVFNTDKAKYAKLIDTVEIFYEALCFSFLAVTLKLFPAFISIYTRNVTDIVYQDAFLPLLFVVIELLIFMRKPMLNTIGYAGHFKETLPQTIAEMVLNLSISIVASYCLGIYGVLLGTVVALTYRFIDLVIYCNKCILDRDYKKTFLIYMINIVLFVVFQILVFPFGNKITSCFQFILFGLGFTVVSVVLFIGTNAVIFSNERQYIQRINNMHLFHI